MPKDASLKPKKIQSRANRGQSAWMLSIPPDLSDNGKRQQKFYSTQRDAETAAEVIKRRRDNFGNSLTLLSPERIAQAAEGFTFMDEKMPHLSLLEILEDRYREESKRVKSLAFGEVFDQYIKSRHSKTPEHLQKLRKCKDRFTSLHAKLVCDLTYEDFERVLDKQTPSMRNALMRLLRAVINRAIKRHYLDKNPINSLDFADIKRKQVEVFPLEVVEKMLNDAAQHDLELLGFFSLGLFAGIRSFGELRKLQWSAVSLDQNLITIPPEVSKTGTERHIYLEPNAVAWLRLTGEHPPTQKILTCTYDEYRNKKKACWQRISKGQKWIHSGMRHTFCSMWLNAFEDQNKLLMMVGHSTPQMLRQRYYRGGLKSEALKFWHIMPPVT